MPVAMTAFGEAQSLAVGSKLRIMMSPQIRALAAEVSGRSVASDGTTVTRLSISGDVPGTLILQNNPANNFFLGQLYYDGLAVAYEFHLVKDGLTVTRHQVSALVCAFMNADGTAIASRGLPPVDMARVQAAQDVPRDHPAGSPVAPVPLGSKPVAAAAAVVSTLSVNDVAMLEGNSGTTNMVFTVKLSQANSKSIVTAKYATANGSATAGSDYTAVSGTVTFPKGSTTQTIAVPIRGNITYETDETFSLNLSSPVNATIADGTGVGTIINDDAAPVVSSAVSINNVTMLEGNSGFTNMLFTVSLSKADSLRVVTVSYATSDGSASAGSDYTAVSGTVTFPTGSTTQTIAVPILGDTTVEASETFTLNLTNPVNATIAGATGVGTITNNNVAPVVSSAVSINDVTMLEGNSGFTNMLFTVSLSKADSLRVVTVDYATSDGSATAGSDYTAVTGTVTFPMGGTTQTIAVPIPGDTTVEASETFTLNLTNPVNATIADATGVGTITNNNVAPSNVPVHNSLPGAVAVAYLDMDGQVDASLMWSASTIVARGISDTFTQDQMSEIWRRVTEDYAPFQINVTTDESVYLAAPANRRIRCIITPDNEWYGAVGGVSYVNSFTWPGDVACWVFSDQLSNSPRFIAESCAHEIGHTLGLAHHGRMSPAEIYYAGQGSGDVGWAPIMGVGYYRTLVQWSKGEYLSSNNPQDDLAIITSKNGFSYRIDQHSNTGAGATPLTISGTAVSGAGIIETRDDVDVFSFTTHGGTVTINVAGDATSSNLDILAEIKDAGGNTLVSVNPDLLLNASIVTPLTAGTYYLYVSGVGRGDYLVDGYTDYGSLGQYAISGNVP